MTFEEYLKTQEEEYEDSLREMYTYLTKLLPQAEFCISYGMPAFKTTEVVIWFARFKNHLGIYPTGAGVKAFEDRLEGYKYSKGAIQLPLKKAIPKKLLQDIIKFRLAAIALKEQQKTSKKKR